MVSTVLLLLRVKHPAHRNCKGRVTRFGAKTRDHRREATLLLLVVLQSGAAVAVVWAHARIQELCLRPLGGGFTNNHVEGHAQQTDPHIYRLTVTERRL